jgi:hypothetical protein
VVVVFVATGAVVVGVAVVVLVVVLGVVDEGVEVLVDEVQATRNASTTTSRR